MSRVAYLVVAAALAQAACAAPLRQAVSHHETRIADEALCYTATVREFPVKDPAGRVGAWVVTIAYTHDGVAQPAARPVIFAFNGGPGASSSPLHMKAMGPIVREKSGPDDRSESRLVANESSPLDVADLVFIDPVSTGFSRALPGVDPKPWYDSRFDARTVADVIAQWLRVNGREHSPRFLMGESYGAIRAALIANGEPASSFDGVLLVSGPGTPFDAPPDVQIVGSVASLAAGAWYHGRVDRRGLTSAQFFEAAAAFARGPYAQALASGDGLPAEERQRIAAALSDYIGLPVPLILEKNLRIDANTWMFNVLKDRGLRTGRLDLRVTSPLLPGQEGAIDDPALGVVPQGKAGPPPTPASLGAIESPVAGAYLKEQLGFAAGDPYIGVNFLANSQWTFHRDGGSEANMASAMARDSHLRLFVTAGYFDYGASDGVGYLDAGVPAARFTFVPLPGPHEVYDGAENRAAFNDAVRRFVMAEQVDAGTSDSP